MENRKASHSQSLVISYDYIELFLVIGPVNGVTSLYGIGGFNQVIAKIFITGMRSRGALGQKFPDWGIFQ
ncbi:MAG: hypothetical protein ACE3JK_02875 [Sporolactobacillus sp.]